MTSTNRVKCQVVRMDDTHKPRWKVEKKVSDSKCGQFSCDFFDLANMILIICIICVYTYTYRRKLQNLPPGSLAQVTEFAYRKPGSSCWIAPWWKLASSHGSKGIACVVAMGFDRAHARYM